MRHEVPLVTHNARHFEGIAGLQIVTEGTWEDGLRIDSGEHG